jgi:DNA-binding NarL/FixJ family response regulator
MLLDITMPGMDGIECCHLMREKFPNLVIAMFTGRSVRDYFDPARLAGADAFIGKDIAMDQLPAIVRQLRRHEDQCLCVGSTVSIKSSALKGTSLNLTMVDRQIMELLAAGMTIKAMAGELGRHEQTIKKHLLSCRIRLCAQSNAEAIARWLKSGEAFSGGGYKSSPVQSK